MGVTIAKQRQFNVDTGVKVCEIGERCSYKPDSCAEKTKIKSTKLLLQNVYHARFVYCLVVQQSGTTGK